MLQSMEMDELSRAVWSALQPFFVELLSSEGV